MKSDNQILLGWKKGTASLHTYIFSKRSVCYFLSLLEELRGVTVDPSFSNCNTNKILRKCNRNSMSNCDTNTCMTFFYRWQMSNGPFLKDQNGTRKVIRLKVLEEVSLNISWSDPSLIWNLTKFFFTVMVWDIDYTYVIYRIRLFFGFLIARTIW